MLRVRCQAHATLDTKGRLALPAPIRRALGENGEVSLVLSYHRGAVWGWTPRDYEDTVERPLSSRDPFAPEVTDFVHAIMAPAQDCEIDAAGRIRIPQPLRDRAGLDRDVVVTSVQNRLEIWDRAAWERAYEMAVANYEKRGGMPGFGT